MASVTDFSERFDLGGFLRTYQRMAILPSRDIFLLLEGKYDFAANPYDPIVDFYDLQIIVTDNFPNEVPAVYETAGRIPRKADYHINDDGTLCLGSRLRVLWILSKFPTLMGFAEKCLTPYLYAISYKFKYGGSLPFGELAHGTPGELSDYADLFGLENEKQVRMVIQYLGMKKRRANKLPCPCGCGHRLGKCRFNWRIRQFRQLAERGYFRSLL